MSYFFNRLILQLSLFSFLYLLVFSLSCSLQAMEDSQDYESSSPTRKKQRVKLLSFPWKYAGIDRYAAFNKRLTRSQKKLFRQFLWEHEFQKQEYCCYFSSKKNFKKNIRDIMLYTAKVKKYRALQKGYRNPQELINSFKESTGILTTRIKRKSEPSVEKLKEPLSKKSCIDGVISYDFPITECPLENLDLTASQTAFLESVLEVPFIH